MIKIILKGKYDIDSFYYNDFLKVIISKEKESKQLNFGARIVYTKFYEEELANKKNFLYYDVLGEKLEDTTLIQDTESQLLKKIESETGDFYLADELKHYIIVALNYIMEIVTYDDIIDETFL
ncbi:MAG: hypothetical protein MJ159_04085 [Treponemataceae bacterium]|nr:hypothetical protein [Treponemataceae bacterium]